MAPKFWKLRPAAGPGPILHKRINLVPEGC